MPRKTKNYRKNYRKDPLSQRQAKAVQKIATRSMMQKAETKMKSTEIDAVAVGPDDAGYIINNLSTLAQGTDNENRIGDSVVQSGIQFKYYMENTSANPFHYLVRCILFQTKKDEFNATTDNFLLSTGNEPLALTGNDNLDIVRSLNRKQIGRVLYDKVHEVSSTTTSTGNGKAVVYRTKFFKLGNKKVQFPNDASTESNYNNVRALFIVRDAGGSTVAAANDIALTVMSRFYYKDF